jgi:hypothetical protein
MPQPPSPFAVRACLTVCVAAVLAAAAPAMAQTLSPEEAQARAEALEVFRQGKLAYKAGDYDAALRLFQTAHGKYSREPLIILALAKTLDQARNVETAQKYYKLFLDQAPLTQELAKDREATAQRVRDIDKELASRPGTLKFHGLPSGAHLAIDERAADVDAQGEVKVPAGTHRIRVTMDNREPFERPAVSVGPGQTKLVEVVLVAPIDPRTLPRNHTWTWVAGSAASASALASGVFFVLAYRTYNNEFLKEYDKIGVPLPSTQAAYPWKGKPCGVGIEIQPPDPKAGQLECVASGALDHGKALDAEIDSYNTYGIISAGAAAVFGFATLAAWYFAPPNVANAPSKAATAIGSPLRVALVPQFRAQEPPGATVLLSLNW